MLKALVRKYGVVCGNEQLQESEGCDHWRDEGQDVLSIIESVIETFIILDLIPLNFVNDYFIYFEVLFVHICVKWMLLLYGVFASFEL